MTGTGLLPKRPYIRRMASSDLLIFTERGTYCPMGDFYIDPTRSVDRALITHAHSDHARAGHRRYLASAGTGPMLRHRLGKIDLETLGYAEPRSIGDVSVSFHPAGHLPGSAQIRVEHKGQVWVVSGDYKTEADGLSDPFVPVPCHTFVTECTFGLPLFNWAPQSQVARDINGWWRTNRDAGRFSILGAYALGKAQRLLAMLDPAIGPVLTHGAIEATNAVLRTQGVPLPGTVAVTPELDLDAYPGALVLAPPAAIQSAWTQRFGPAATGFASGWMALRGVRRRRSADRGFVLSDHADWQGLNAAIKATGAERIFVTHGYTSIFQRWLSGQGYDAAIAETGFERDNAEAAP